MRTEPIKIKVKSESYEQARNEMNSERLFLLLSSDKIGADGQARQRGTSDLHRYRQHEQKTKKIEKKKTENRKQKTKNKSECGDWPVTDD